MEERVKEVAMAKPLKRADGAKMQPPMTPMIDCTFNLLIFFLLTPSFSLAEGYLTTNLPAGPGPGGIEVAKWEYALKIALRDAGPRGEDVDIVLNDHQSLGSNFQALGAALQGFRVVGLSAECPVLIAPTAACRHKWVVKAFDEAVAARFDKIHFAVPSE
jgi:biopolymer transport protein ExbD